MLNTAILLVLDQIETINWFRWSAIANILWKSEDFCTTQTRLSLWISCDRSAINKQRSTYVVFWKHFSLKLIQNVCFSRDNFVILFIQSKYSNKCQFSKCFVVWSLFLANKYLWNYSRNRWTYLFRDLLRMMTEHKSLTFICQIVHLMSYIRNWMQRHLLYYSKKKNISYSEYDSISEFAEQNLFSIWNNVLSIFFSNQSRFISDKKNRVFHENWHCPKKMMYTFIWARNELK